MGKKLIGILMGFGLAKGSFGMDDGRRTPFDDIARVLPQELTASQTLNALLTNSAAVSEEEPETSSRMIRRTSAVLVLVGNKLDNKVNSKSSFPIDKELLLNRRAKLLYDLYFSTPEGPECFESKIERKGDVEKYILTYKKDTGLNFHGFMSFDSKKEFLFCLEVLAEKAKSSSHIDKVNVLLVELRKG
ncbi:MAG: hypothetical protein K2Y18_01295 [Alphaproteobacteria bacterium]|jgi:hypothetical protein|nr:hypothetical protein [Alphaproteobacteria bacterium]